MNVNNHILEHKEGGHQNPCEHASAHMLAWTVNWSDYLLVLTNGVGVAICLHWPMAVHWSCHWSGHLFTLTITNTYWPNAVHWSGHVFVLANGCALKWSRVCIGQWLCIEVVTCLYRPMAVH
jgi:hypothetical protein